MTVPPIILHGNVVGRRRHGLVLIALPKADGTCDLIRAKSEHLLLNEPVTITITADIPEYGSKVLKAIRTSETP